MAILTLTSADAGKTIPVSGSADWVVYGTDAADTIEVAAGSSATVNGGAGTDVVKLLGGSADYTVKLSGSNVVFTHTSTGKTVTVPVTSAGDSVSFGNGTAVTLKSTGSVVTLGAQTISATDAAVTGATGTATGSTPTTAGQAFSLTTATETKTLTSGNDTVDGSVLDSVSSDTLIDASSTDNDTANLLVSGDTTLPTSSLNIETVNLTAKYGAATLNGANYIGVKTLTLDSAIAGGVGTVTNATIASVKAGNNISTLSVTTANAISTTVIDGGAATSVTANGNAKADTITVGLAAGTNSLAINGNAGTDAYTLNLKGGTLSLTGNTANETVNIVGSTAAQRVNVTTAIGGTTVVSGDQNVTLSGIDSVFHTNTVTNSLASGKTLTVEITGAAATADLSKVAATTFDQQGTGASGVYTLANNANVKVNNAVATTYTAATGATTLNLDVALAAVGTLTNSTFTTVNVAANSVDVTTALDAQFGTSADIKLSGSKAVAVASTATYKSLDAASLTGKLTITDLGTAGQAITTGGSGNDSLSLGTFVAATTVNGGAGDDTVIIAATATTTGDYQLTLDGGTGNNTLQFAASTNLSNGTNDKTSIISGFNKIDIGTTTVHLTQKQLFTNGSSFLLSGTGGTLNVVDDGASSKVFDLSTLTFDVGVAAPTISISGHATLANNIKGSAAAETITGGAAADTISGGAGADSIVAGGGVDTITGGTGGDTINFTTGSVTFGSATSQIQVTDFAFNTGGDTLVFGGTAAAGNVAISGWTISSGVYSKSGATVADFYAAIAGASNLAGEVGAFVSGGNTYLFAEGAATTAGDDVYVVLTGVTATSVAASAGASAVLIA